MNSDVKIISYQENSFSRETVVSLTPKRRPFEQHLQNSLTATNADVSDSTEYIFSKPFSSTETCNSSFAVTTLNHIRMKGEKIKKKHEGKFVSVHAVMAYGGNRDIAPFILNIRIRWSYQLHSPAVLRRYPLNRRLVGLQS
jgi:hypothetical protein